MRRTKKGRVPSGHEDKKAHLNIFPPNWLPGFKRNYLGSDRKPILPFSYVKVDFSYATPKYRKELRKTYPWKEPSYSSSARFASVTGTA